MIAKTSNQITQRITCFLSIVFGVYFIPWLIGMLFPAISETVFAILRFPGVFMATPALAVFLTRKITKDTAPLPFSTKVRKNKKALAFSALLPACAIFLGAILFYLIFPDDLDYTGRFISENFAQYGAPTEIQFTIRSMLVLGLIALAISTVAVPIWFIALGEDIGWQGYLLPLLCKKLPMRPAVLITGTLWGLGHAPLIYWGFNYGSAYPGAPWGGIAMMVLVCMVMGIWMSYITLKSRNCMYAAVIHGAVDIIGEVPIWLSLSTQSTLLGPNPSGIIGMSFLILGAVFLLFRLPKEVQF